MLSLALPTGPLEAGILSVFASADLDVRRGGRDGSASIDDPRISRVELLPPRDIPAHVGRGLVDFGLAGVEQVRQAGAAVVTVAVFEPLLESGAELVANAAAWADPEKRAAMEDVAVLLRGAIAARGKVLLKLDVADEQLDAVLAQLPAMTSPTVAPLATAGFHAVETVVPRSGVNALLPALKAAGARDILEIAIAKIIQ